MSNNPSLRDYATIITSRDASRALLGGSVQVSPWGVSAGTCRSANARKRERHAKGFLFFDMAATKFVTFNGETKSIRQWSESSGIPYRALLFRVNNGWEFARAITEPTIVGRNQSFGKEPRPAEEVAQYRREASARWRARHREKYLQIQRLSDARPERREKRNAASAAKRRTDEYKAYRKEYLSRPEVAARVRARAKSEDMRAYQREWHKLPHARAYARAAKAAERATPFGLLNNRMRSAIRRGLSRGSSRRLWETLGYTAAELKAHIERQFLPGMSWEDASEWHIDHIIPLSSFNYSSVDDHEFKTAWSLPNLRPLWGRDNLAKNSKIETLL